MQRSKIYCNNKLLMQSKKSYKITLQTRISYRWYIYDVYDVNNYVFSRSTDKAFTYETRSMTKTNGLRTFESTIDLPKERNWQHIVLLSTGQQFLSSISPSRIRGTSAKREELIMLNQNNRNLDNTTFLFIVLF